MKENRRKLPSYFYKGFGGVSLLLFTIAAILFYNDQKVANSYTRVEGVVIRNQVQRKMARPIISFSWNGKEAIYRANTYSNPPAYERGEKVELFVNPGDQEDVYINSFIGRFLAMTITGVIGLVFLGFLLLFRYIFK